jgi:N-acetyl-gamma-glutamylphosphate reductase
LIVRCPRFTATKSAVSTPMPSPAITPVEYARKAPYQGCYQAPAIPAMAPLPASQYTPPMVEPQYTGESTSSGSSQSDNESVFSSCSSASSTSSTSSFTHVSLPPAHKPCARVVQQQTYVSPPPSTNTWFNPFIQAANLVKHVSFQSPMLTAPVHVY